MKTLGSFCFDILGLRFHHHRRKIRSRTSGTVLTCYAFNLAMDHHKGGKLQSRTSSKSVS